MKSWCLKMKQMQKRMLGNKDVKKGRKSQRKENMKL